MLKITSPSTVAVAVVVFDGISPFHLSVPGLVFDTQHEGVDKPSFKVCVCAMEPKAGNHTIRTNAGFTFNIKHGLSILKRADMIVIPSWSSNLDAPPEHLLVELRKAHKRGARIVGLCLGAFVLAEAGLLNQRTATTHWAKASEFTQRYPQITLVPNVLYVDHGDVITSAGTAAGIDCCLHILRSQYGSDIAAHVARKLVIAPHRQGGQAQYIDQPLPVLASDGRLSSVLEWMLQNLGEQQPIDQLAQRALMSRRSFTRHFQKLTGTTVGQWLLNQRLCQAQRQLESTRCSIDDIAIDTGFGSALVLRRHFARTFNTSPSAYRREFQGTETNPVT
ncbi:helix-turn-helix domain-containing protein [Solimicrobium silvestre]|uniref:Transcriptional regulator containing an amidase domain and an AraC-type DNA-binding HTH domain n=1 Tax=Solimicrobium silvestre TaxID=2099400 RepID=A0A2S9H3D2_9BURK|nr:helix-turn-helix domain-containing protein [Solimicrobium silvestre]PRC94494.1 Transcriptional regulator containing an amidase domain and an AraC-type DNA-binding HTH domain [Solimicrobium silvestre]